MTPVSAVRKPGIGYGPAGRSQPAGALTQSRLFWQLWPQQIVPHLRPFPVSGRAVFWAFEFPLPTNIFSHMAGCFTLGNAIAQSDVLLG